MLASNINIYGEAGNEIDFLLDETGLYERVVDIFLIGVSLGILYDLSEKNSNAETKKSIFPGVLNKENSRIKLLSTLGYLIIHDEESKLENNELLREAFGDWYSNDEFKEKYDSMIEFGIGGIHYLYKKITMNNATSKDEYLRNYFKLVKEIDEDKLDNLDERAILKGIRG